MKPKSSLPASAAVRLTWAGRFAADRDVQNHLHSGTEIVCVKEGACAIEVDGILLPGEVNSLFVLPPQVIQYQHTYRFTRTTYLGFLGSLPYFSEHPRVLKLQRSEVLLRWLEDLADLHSHNKPSQAGHSLLAAVLQRLTELEEEKCDQLHWHPAVEKAVGLLEKWAGPPESLDKLAARASVSPNYLCALFQQQFGCGPMKYQQRLRLQRASRLLNNPYLRIQEVATQCGYDDVNYFVRIFKREFGMPPGQWRLSSSK